MPASGRLPRIDVGVVAIYGRECEIEGGALSYGAFGPKLTAKAANDPMNRREPDACSWKFSGTMESLECAKELMDIGGIKADAIVSDKINEALFLDGASHFNTS